MAGDYGERQYHIYIMANSRHQIYVGVTGNLARRVYQHKNKLTEGHASRYNMTMLIYYESTSDVNSAIAREKQLKGWNRRKKDALIATTNPRWVDLSLEWFESEGV